MYHAFGDESDRYVVSRRAFARQMRLLSLLRCHVLSLGELGRAIAGGEPVPARSVVLTIDDGYVDAAAVAAETIARHGFRATVFVVTGRLGGVNDWSESEPLRGRQLLSRDELLSLRGRGLELGAHTRSHPDLVGLDDGAIAEEVASSRSDLEEILGEPVRTFAYPYGRVDDRVADAVRAAGFESACTVVPRPAGLDDDPLRVPRIEIEGSDSLLRFLRKLVTAWA
jgi:peptidoglycan/xylan/chitin deacetylase (PgdA/CDA1 family)